VTKNPNQMTSPGNAFDAILLISFGGPEGMNEVLPFLENVLRGRNVPEERKLAVAEHYYLFGGVSPINEQNRKLIAALKEELEACSVRLPIYWGNRNWHPLLADTVQQMAADGIKNALAFVTSAYSSYSSCRQYLENISSAQASSRLSAPRIQKIRAFYNHPAFIKVNSERVQTAFERIPPAQRRDVELVFTAHSIPVSMAQNCSYQAQLLETARLVATSVGHSRWRLAFQSRSGAPNQPWLGPDILDCLKDLKGSGTRDVLVAPIGFVSDHLEVVYDLDVEAQRLASELGINLVRASTAGTDPAFVAMVRELIFERIEPGTCPRFLGALGASPDVCAPDCCLPRD